MKKLITLMAIIAVNFTYAAPSAEAKKIITLLGIDTVFSAHGPFPAEMIKDMDAKGLSPEKIITELAEALEKDFTQSEIKEFAVFLEGPIWTKFKKSEKDVYKESTGEFSRTLGSVSTRWNEYMSDKTLLERK